MNLIMSQMIILVSFLFPVGIGLLTIILTRKSIDFWGFFPSLSQEVHLITLIVLLLLLFLFQDFANIVDPGDLVKLLECKFWGFAYYVISISAMCIWALKMF